MTSKCPYCGGELIVHDCEHKRHPNQKLHKCTSCQCYCVVVGRLQQVFPLSDKNNEVSDAITIVKK